MLEDGFTGPTLGLECAGRIVRVGSSVKNFKVGDRVVTFAASAFSTHVTVPALHAAKLPPNLSCEDAATIPVAFLTAYYSLVTLADLKKGEWVLIHGAAGGIGMAAIQIAQSLGARIIATAGSPAKRDLLRALGVHHVLDSRSIGFVDDVGEITGTGVDVVLNSLAGEAMERSIACLRAFGRFVELGKRDYVTNTHIGLRPFRKNLSYFGVDLDQLISGRPLLGAKIYAEVMAQFRNYRFKPLPYSVFEASGVFEAFHLMQHSSHVGKIVVRPPKPGSVRAANKPLVISADGTHIVTGAFGGFGLETVKWLVDRGARHLVLIGRSGAASAEAKAVLGDIAERGVKVIADPCDITDLRALERLFEKIQATMPRVVGVIHAAMVLDDAIIKNLDADRFNRVLAPKVAGAENLDLVTRGQPLDYFVLFSSVTTMMGNPGQGNYVAANAYMEGLARRRRQEGLPALAIGWGPITDVGVVARSDKLQDNLKRLTGVSGMRAREALESDGAGDGTAVRCGRPRGHDDFAERRLVPLEPPAGAAFADLRLPGGSRSRAWRKRRRRHRSARAGAGREHRRRAPQGGRYRRRAARARASFARGRHQPGAAARRHRARFADGARIGDEPREELRHGYFARRVVSPDGFGHRRRDHRARQCRQQPRGGCRHDDGRTARRKSRARPRSRPSRACLTTSLRKRRGCSIEQERAFGGRRARAVIFPRRSDAPVDPQ